MGRIYDIVLTEMVFFLSDCAYPPVLGVRGLSLAVRQVCLAVPYQLQMSPFHPLPPPPLFFFISFIFVFDHSIYL